MGVDKFATNARSAGCSSFPWARDVGLAGTGLGVQIHWHRLCTGYPCSLHPSTGVLAQRVVNLSVDVSGTSLHFVLSSVKGAGFAAVACEPV